MNTRCVLSKVALVAGALLFSLGLQAFAAFTQPSTSPPNADASAPINVGSTPQTKAGGLILNSASAITGLVVYAGNVGIDTGLTLPVYPLDVAGQIRLSSGGYIFPDGTVQTTAYVPGGEVKPQVFNSSGIWVKPAGVNIVLVTMCGGGGGPYTSYKVGGTVYLIMCVA